MNTVLIDQFLDAAKKWAAKTGSDVFAIVVMSAAQVGIFQDKQAYIQAGNDFRAYLIQLVEKKKISQSLLIAGLIKTLEIDLMHMANSYDESVQKQRSIAEFFERIIKDSIFREQINQGRQADGLESYEVEDFERLQEIVDHYKKQADDVNDNEAERKMALLEWQEITAPLLEYNNLRAIMENDQQNLRGLN